MTWWLWVILAVYAIGSAIPAVTVLRWIKKNKPERSR